MATKLYFHAATTGVAGTLPASNVSVSATSPTQIADGVNHTMNRTIGVSQTSIVLTTNGTANAQPSLIGRFVSDRLASQTFALTTIGDISLSIAGAESNAGSNFQVRISLATWRPSTGAVVTRIHDLATNATLEPGTTQTSLTATNAAGGTSATVADGDILICEVWRDSTVPGATTARTNTIFYDGTTEASITTNAAFINFPNDTLTFAPQQFTQTQADIKQTYNQFTQTQTDIKATYNQFTQAQAKVIILSTGFTQAQGLIDGTFSTVVDTFTRTVSNGWGTADTGGDWTRVTGTASNFNTNGSVGTIVTAGTENRIDLGSVSAPRNTEFTFQFSINSLPSSVLNVSFHVHLGSAVTLNNTSYQFRTLIASSGLVSLLAIHGAGSVTTTSATVVPGDLWNVKGRLLRTDSTGFMVSKLWKVGDSEPEFSTNLTFSEVGGTPRGHVGFDNPGSVSTPITFTFDNLNLYQAFPVAHTQAQAVIQGATVQQQYTQSQADIKAIGQQYTQAQADINAVSQKYTQSQADVKQTYNQFIQSQADIKATNNQFTQSQADIKTTNNQFTQTNSRIILAQSAYERLVRTTAGIQSYWKLDEINGTSAYDYVGSITGTHVGTVTKNVTPSTQLTGTGITVVGTGNKVTAGDNYDFATGSNAIFSVEAWVKTVGTAGNYIVSKLSGLDGWFIGVDPEGTASFNLNTNLAVSTTSINDGNWYHIVGTTNGVNIKVYVNGILYSGASSNTLIDTTALLTFGGNSESTSLDEIAIYNTALSVDDIQAHYTLAKSGAIVRITQAQASIKQTSNQFTQTQADIKTTTNQFTQSQADIKQTYVQCTQTQTYIILSNQNQFTQSQADIKQTYQQYEQAQADIKQTYSQFMQSQADIKATEQNYWQAQSDIKQTYVQCTQAQALIKTPDINQFTQAQADINQTYQQYTQAQSSIKQTYNQFTQAQGDIKATEQAYWQAQGNIKQTYNQFTQSQADIKATEQAYTQAQAYIKTVDNCKFTQAQADIKTTGQQYTQAQAKINAFNVMQFTQAQGNVASSGNFGPMQAQAKINAFGYPQFTQSQADIKATEQTYIQAQGDIKQTYQQYTQSQADVKQAYNQFTQTEASIKQTYNQFCQAQADIKATEQNYWQAQGQVISSNQNYWQAQANIIAGTNQFTQAQATIKITNNNFWQAQADIKVTQQAYTQAQGYVKITSQQYEQAQSAIKITSNAYTQAQADINATNNQFYQAQASIKQTSNQYTSAQASIKVVSINSYQAQALITTRNTVYEQAQAWILTTNVAHMQAQAFITFGAAYWQAQAMITQPHTLKRLTIRDRDSLNLTLGDRPYISLGLSDRESTRSNIDDVEY